MTEIPMIRIQGTVSRGIRGAHIDDNGRLIFTLTDGSTISAGVVGTGSGGGAPGADGISASHKWEGTVLTVTSAAGTSSADLKGEKGDPGDKGDPGADGVSVPAGGTSGQILAKLSDADNHMGWVDPPVPDTPSQVYGVTVGFTVSADGTLTCDSTFAQTAAAIEAGALTKAKVYDAATGAYHHAPLARYLAGQRIQFAGWIHSGTQSLSRVYTLDAGDTVTMTQPVSPMPEIAKPTNVRVSRYQQYVTVTAAYDNGTAVESVITLGDDDLPVTVATDGVQCAMSWEGFDG